nr:hypothetical protein [Mycobacterium haemophilum]
MSTVTAKGMLRPVNDSIVVVLDPAGNFTTLVVIVLGEVHVAATVLAA